MTLPDGSVVALNAGAKIEVVTQNPAGSPRLPALLPAGSPLVPLLLARPFNGDQFGLPYPVELPGRRDVTGG